jgi:transposase
MTLPQDVIGVDIARDWIDVFRLSTGQHQRVATAGPALARFARAAKGALVVLEASGGYERPVAAALAKAGTSYARVNPRQAREFARATGRLAKTDRADAALLARMGRALELAPTPPETPARRQLAEMVGRRDDLVDSLRRERCRAATAADRWVVGQIAALVAVLEGHLAAVEERIAALIEAVPPFEAAARRLRSVPGVGFATTAVLIARLPELGRIDARGIASLAGLAPHACDSGLHRGTRHIWGGRAEVRRALYIAAFVASRHDPVFKAFRTRLTDAGKPLKVALTACARKLLTILNAMIRTGQDYRRQSA